MLFYILTEKFKQQKLPLVPLIQLIVAISKEKV